MVALPLSHTLNMATSQQSAAVRELHSLNPLLAQLVEGAPQKPAPQEQSTGSMAFQDLEFSRYSSWSMQPNALRVTAFCLNFVQQIRIVIMAFV